MNQAFLAHLQHNWPLAIIAIGLFIYIPITMIKGVFYTNQGRIVKSSEPSRYWKWTLSFIALDFACIAVLLMSFIFSTK